MTHISSTRQLEALENIKVKLGIISSWAKNGFPAKSEISQREEFFPRSLRQFKLWDGSQNSEKMRSTLPHFTKTGNDTLAKHKEFQANISQVILILVHQAAKREGATSAGKPKKNEIANEIRLLRESLKIRSIELIEQQRQIISLERELVTLRRKLKLYE